MNQEQEKPKVESQPVSQPAGEATGSDLPPEGQGGPHLPEISEPTGKSLSEQFESGPQTVEQPAEEPHKCFVCNGPDHRACGCEARETQKQIEQDDKTFRSQDIMKEELEEANATKVLGDEITEAISKASGLDPQIVQICAAGGRKFAEDMQNVLDRLSDINSNLEILVKLEKDRADLLRDIKNVGANQN